ncbi:MAG: dihydroorotate dehydrogenase electron transfer subunit [Coriobacteriia bacterium]|nr:dihydroorotate dehydrogenase electron transfer subunit [Coriobacteriia bacterium]MBS5477808.1 dihydroorotate dehydrogenase electron transfer subunit [Coriobacteriia bacterium]
MPTPSTATRHTLTVVSNEPMTCDVMRMRFTCPELARSIEPGQFFDLAVPGDPSQLVRLPFSYSAADAQTGEVEFGYLLNGDGTRRLAQVKPGAQLDVLGPCGHGWRFPEGMKAALLVGGGSGVVPLVSLARELIARGVAVDFIEGAAAERRVIFTDDLREMGVRTLEIATDDGSVGIKGYASVPCEQMLADNAYDVVYVCGPTPMMRGIAQIVDKAGVACQVSMEKMMTCGFGACATCVCDTTGGRKGVCMAGPVFDAKEVVW